MGDEKTTSDDSGATDSERAGETGDNDDDDDEEETAKAGDGEGKDDDVEVGDCNTMTS